MSIFHEKWHIVTCSAGESCWCRIITTNPESDDMEYCVVPSGAISKEVAEHVVNLHNKSL